PPLGATDTNAANDRATATDPLQRVTNLGVTKTGSATLVMPGAKVTYTIVVTNFGPSTVTSLKLVDTLPTQFLNPVYRPSAGSSNPATGDWTGLNLAKNQSVTMTITATVATNASGAKVNQVVVSPPAGVTDSDISNNTAFFTFTVFPSKRSLLSSFRRP